MVVKRGNAFATGFCFGVNRDGARSFDDVAARIATDARVSGLGRSITLVYFEKRFVVLTSATPEKMVPIIKSI